MKIDIRITVGDKIIADSYAEPDEIFRLRQFPRDTITHLQRKMNEKMSEAMDRAIKELFLRGVVREPTSYPPRTTANVHGVTGGVS